MEIMEDGNLVDRVRILLQRDMQYYKSMQTVLRESLCTRVSGGKLDFPRHASFAAIKIVTWWEAEFFAAFQQPSGLNNKPISRDECSAETEEAIKKTPPSEFILLVVDTSKEFLEHLHTLTQESLDHADLTVLTATLGAAALIRNALWCYNQESKDKISAESSAQLSECFKTYKEMAEAVAERLLDLHCRLISLYILNEAESLSWMKDRTFFEKERGTFVIQMWWLYMQGTRADLWNACSPKMAQRVFSGMLNESLTILVTRFMHGRPSLARSEQFWCDAFNVLCCTANLTLSTCDDANVFIGLRPKKLPTAIRDIHAKCGELLFSLLLRGTPLSLLFQVCRNGLENMAVLRERSGIAPWLLVEAPQLLGSSLPLVEYGTKDLPARARAILELNILRSQPQANWTQTLKVLSLNDCAVARLLFGNLVRKCLGYTEIRGSKEWKSHTGEAASKEEGCGGFLCPGVGCSRSVGVLPPSLHLYSLAYITVNTFMNPLNVVIPAIEQDVNWPHYFERQQVWNQARPPWLNGLLAPLSPMMVPIVETLLDAVKTGASIYQAMSLALACIAELYVCAPLGVLTASLAINDKLPAHCHPLCGSVILHVMCASLYTALLEVSVIEEESTEKSDKRETPRSADESATGTISFDPRDKSASALALAEALCSIDEDNKHTDQINDLNDLIEKWVRSKKPHEQRELIESSSLYIETFTNIILLTDIGRRTLKIVHDYLIRASDWLLKNLKAKEANIAGDYNDTTDAFVMSKPLTYAMFHIGDAPFDQFLTNFNKAHWEAILKTPISAKLERVRSQILLRPDLKNLGEISAEQKEVAESVKSLCSIKR